jgi:hypothetical protein
VPASSDIKSVGNFVDFGMKAAAKALNLTK